MSGQKLVLKVSGNGGDVAIMSAIVLTPSNLLITTPIMFP